jgi:hypothetical protein
MVETEKKVAKKETTDNEVAPTALMCFYFFDGETGTALYPAVPELAFRRSGVSEWSSPQPLSIVKTGEYEGRYSLLWNEFSKVIGAKVDEAVNVEIRLASTTEISCTRYTSEIILTRVRAAETERPTNPSEDAKQQPMTCCCLPIPLFELEETCVVKFRAYDSSFEDFVENSEAFLDGVELVATAMQTPAAPLTPSTTSLTTTASTPAFQAGAFSATTVQGSTELAGLAHNQLYQLEVRSLSGYIIDRLFPQYLYICCERVVELHACFRPCGKYPNRSLIFVREECSGIRWENSPLELQGRPLQTDTQGFLPIPRDMVGVAQLNYPGKTFTPASVDLSAGNPVTVITVGETQQNQITVSHQFVDDNDVPFRFRKLIVLLPTGETRRLMTDESGRFEVPPNSTVYAEEDEYGLATEPVLVSTLPAE